MVAKVERILARIDDADHPLQLDLPGYRLHRLRGDFQGTWAITVSANWRITFRFDGSDAHDVDLIDLRFSNPRIVDTTRRVAFDGSSRHTGFILPVVRDALAAKAPIAGLALTEALWARMCEGTREDGSLIEPNDPIWDKPTAAAKAARENPQAWLEQRALYGDLADNSRFADAFARWLTLIWSEGLETALSQYLGNWAPGTSYPEC